jgi:AcrR family transcriptional regulator
MLSAARPGRPYSGGVTEPDAPSAGSPRSGRDRLLTAAYALFSRSGIRAVGIDAITDEANVAKMTLYRNFHGKNDLAVAFLALRDERWVRGWLMPETQARAASPAGQLLAIFDVFTEWFEGEDFLGCPFVTSLLEFEDRDDPVRQACVERLAAMRAYLAELATAAGVAEPERFAAQWHILMKGAIVSAHEGDLDAAMKARELGRLLLAREGLAELAPINGDGDFVPDDVAPEEPALQHAAAAD